MNAVVPTPLTVALRSSLEARIERLLQRPIVARLNVQAGGSRASSKATGLGFFDGLDALHVGSGPRTPAVTGWKAEAGGGATVGIFIDYDDLWRGQEREVLEEVEGTREREVVLLTSAQAKLLEQSPREFLQLLHALEAIELVDYATERIGGAERVTALSLVSAPMNPGPLTHVAILPNLTPLQRQLSALRILEDADHMGPLAPLRALVGLPAAPLSSAPRERTVMLSPPTHLDPHQRAAVESAGRTPHFATIQGPPGSGKTTVISTILQQALAEGQRVLVVSPTNVATDNVVEKLTGDGAQGAESLAPVTLPVRYASKPGRMLPGAMAYWVGPTQERRAVTVGRRLQARLAGSSRQAAAWYAALDTEQAGAAPLSGALARQSWVLCGTPIGLLSSSELRGAQPATFDLLVVDEVSKLTLPEFLAIAVYARRWVLVGDPQQLPPYNDACDNGATAEEVLGAGLELVCSVAAVLERMRTPDRSQARLVVVVATEPDAVAVAVAIEEQLREGGLDAPPPVRVGPERGGAGIIVCTPGELGDAVEALSPSRRLHRGHNPSHRGSVRVLVQRGVAVPRPEHASGVRLVEERERVCAGVFEKVFDTYHAQPWARRAGQKLLPVQFRKGLPRFLPTPAALMALGEAGTWEEAEALRDALLRSLAERFAVNAVSVYDWLVGLPTEHFDVAPMTLLAEVAWHAAALREAAAPFSTVLALQYRMHPSLSVVPREAFYFGEALHDGRRDRSGGCRVRLVQVTDPHQQSRTSRAEAERIGDDLAKLGAGEAADVLVITPYRDQERLLREVLAERDVGALHVEVCTLDRCQGREAAYVLLSLVRPRSTPFLDAPKRWNVALTRAKEGLFIYGNIEAFLSEAARSRAQVRRSGRRPLMSLLARLLSAYHAQIHRNR